MEGLSSRLSRRGLPRLLSAPAKAPSASGFEPVADSAQRFQIAGMPWIAFDFLPQPPHKDVNRPGSHERSFFPHGVQQLVAGKHATAVPREIFEQPELTDGSEYGFALHPHRH